jgi:hypothetical protein
MSCAALFLSKLVKRVSLALVSKGFVCAEDFNAKNKIEIIKKLMILNFIGQFLKFNFQTHS